MTCPNTHLALRAGVCGCCRNLVYVGGIAPGTFINPQQSWTAGKVRAAAKRRAGHRMGPAARGLQPLVAVTCSLSSAPARTVPCVPGRLSAASFRSSLPFPRLQSRLYLVDRLLLPPDTNVLLPTIMPGITIANALQALGPTVRRRAARRQRAAAAAASPLGPAAAPTGGAQGGRSIPLRWPGSPGEQL